VTFGACGEVPRAFFAARSVSFFSCSANSRA
jgi:hypothetical protein